MTLAISNSILKKLPASPFRPEDKLWMKKIANNEKIVLKILATRSYARRGQGKAGDHIGPTHPETHVKRVSARRAVCEKDRTTATNFVRF